MRLPSDPAWRVALRGLFVFCLVAALLLFVRRDRALTLPSVRARDQAKDEQELTNTESKLVEARKELKATEAQLKEKKQALEEAAKAKEAIVAAAPAAARPVAVPAVPPVVDEERDRLAREIDGLKRQLADNDAKAKAARQELDKLSADQAAKNAAAGKPTRPNVVPVKPVDPNTLGRGAILDQQTKFDPRRFRDPSMPKADSSAAAVAAAGSGGAARGGGVVFPGSTVGGDIARGQAEFMRAAGELNLNNSKSAILWQEAKKQEMDNRLRWTETFFEMRRVNRTARALEAGPRPTMDQIVHYARMQAPRRLSSLELDPVTGAIAWPIALTSEDYEDNRAFLQDQFRQRVQHGGSIAIAQLESVETAVDDFKDELRKNVAKVKSAKRYGAARTFLDSLKLEYELPVQ